MVSKVNLKARIERHSRILKDNLTSIHPFRSLYQRLNYNIVFFAVIFLFPIYPSFSSFLYENSVYDFYRGDIDESSIIDAYENEESVYLESEDGFLSVNTMMEGHEKVSEGVDNAIIDYEVQNGDSFSSIAYKFGVSNNSILWANNFDAKKVLHPGDRIKIPPVTGVIHKVVSGDTLSGIAKKYNIDLEKIKLQNGLGADGRLITGDVIVVPGAIYEAPKPVNKPKPKVLAIQKPEKQNNKKPASQKTTKNPTKQSSVSGGGASEYVVAIEQYELVKRAPKWTFYRGNCTRYVAQYKNVDWSGNAKDWLRNARAKGHATGDDASVGSIIVFNGSGYNPRYGHVGIVTGISGDNLIVSDMNYRRPYEVTTRKVPMSDRSIQGYIYVD